MKRQAKFYSKNEKRIMKKLGFVPTPQSGSGWIAKEDGEDDYVLSQLKSTDAESFKISRVDLDKLEYHALVSHKIPLFINQFLKDDAIYLTVNLEDIDSLVEYWQKKKSFSKPKSEPLIIAQDVKQTSVNNNMIKSKGRKAFNEMRRKEYEKFKR